MSLISVGSMSLDISFNFMLITKTGRKNKYLWPKVRSVAYKSNECGCCYFAKLSDGYFYRYWQLHSPPPHPTVL
jgi:hypothetical protein